ncbi:hypothetical protein V5O48_013812 [Marasmius crinis-equi]|uniref:Nucleoid-associated protein n=1 Tax=Marasmius crinis-equi TaxID=585013 RepID=A0ABR3EZ23_9AGAR
MAKTVFVPKEPIEKLPLAVRKDVRDNYEAKKVELEQEISKVLGVAFKANLNTNEIWAYNTDDRASAGGVLFRYVDGFLTCLKEYLNTYGDDGKDHFNNAVSKSELQVHVNPLGDKAPTIDCTVNEGVFVVLFHHQKLGYNQSHIREELLKAVENAPREGLSVRAKQSIKDKYDECIDELRDDIAEMLAMPELIIEPSFEENYKALKAAKTEDSWEETFGRGTYAYFEGLKDQLARQGFKGDEMLQEGVAEMATEKKIVFQVVSKTAKEYNEIVLDGGVIYLRTTPAKWWVNVAGAGEGLVDML